MGKTLYLETDSGISGDMTVAALLDLGADADGLKKVLESLKVQGFEIKISKVKKSGLECMDFDVVLDDEHENHDHDMDYLYGHLKDGHHDNEDEHGHNHHDHEHEHHQHHEDEHEHEHHHHDHEHEHHHHHAHRGFYDIKAIIDNSSLSDHAKEIATNIFKVIAEAEAKAHGEAFENVHFHEVGAVDSIVDVLSVAYAIDNLGITDVIVPFLTEGKGSVRCQHGILPVPVPAVLNIVSEHGIVLHITDTIGELVTPTGAAIVAALKTGEKLPEYMKIVKTGLGAGKREYGRAGILRAMIIESTNI